MSSFMSTVLSALSLIPCSEDVIALFRCIVTLHAGCQAPTRYFLRIFEIEVFPVPMLGIVAGRPLHHSADAADVFSVVLMLLFDHDRADRIRVGPGSKCCGRKIVHVDDDG